MTSSLPILFILGIFSSLSPCFFPLFSSFLAYTVSAKNSVGKGILAGLACLLGIAVSFSIYGVFASILFSLLVEYRIILHSIFGVIIVFLGIATYAEKTFVLINIPNKLLTYKGYLGVFILGLAYTFIAAPCAMPIFFSALMAAASMENIVSTTVNMLMFSIGASFPFLVSPILVVGVKNNFRTQYLVFAKWFKSLSSFILILTGLLLFLPILGFPSIFN